MNTHAVAVRDVGDSPTLALPVISSVEAKAAMAAYQELCESVLSADDYQEFKERGQVKRFKKKSAVKKLQTFWGVTVTVRDVTRDDLGDGHFGFRCVGVAIAPNGRVVEAAAGCSTHEERFTPKRYDNESATAYEARCKKALARSYHDVLSTAETRATNRAVMNCIGVGGGEVTADEISQPKDRERELPAKVVRVTTAGDALLERARKLGVIAADAPQSALKEWAVAAGLPWRVAALEARFAEIELAESEPHNAPKPVFEAWQMSAKQREAIMAMSSELGHTDADRYAFYSRVCGRTIASARELGKLDYETVRVAMNRAIDERNTVPA